jgi:hypothetical protein
MADQDDSELIGSATKRYVDGKQLGSAVKQPLYGRQISRQQPEDAFALLLAHRDCATRLLSRNRIKPPI